jgi:hypothetical protein
LFDLDGLWPWLRTILASKVLKGFTITPRRIVNLLYRLWLLGTKTYNGLMKQRRLGTTELLVSELGLGCQSLGGGLYHRDDEESARTIRAAIDADINFFDVSDHHSQGIAERVLGRACRSRRQDIYITTKAGYRYSQVGNISLRARYYLKPLRSLLRPLKRPLHLFRASQGRYDFRPDYSAS